VAWGLKTIGRGTSFDDIVAAMNDENWRVRIEAVVAGRKPYCFTLRDNLDFRESLFVAETPHAD